MSYMLVGCKCDLDHKRQISKEEGEKLATQHEMLFIETSSYTSHNVDTCFNQITFEIYQKVNKGEIEIDLDGTDGVKPGRENKNVGKSDNIQLTSEKKENNSENTSSCCGD